MENIEQVYFDWLCSNIESSDKYSHLFKHLYETDFDYILEMDGNRYEDGINLRYEFSNELNIPQSEVAVKLDSKACSIFEMLLALSIRVESIMQGLNEEPNPSKWFWEFISNLGLYDMTDAKYDPAYVSYTLDTFIMRKYSPDGTNGNIVYLVEDGRDLRNTEIWIQVMCYLSENGE